MPPVSYLISLAIQAAVVIAVIVIVLLLVRQGKREMPDEMRDAVDRLHSEISLTQDTLINVLGERQARSMAETRQSLLEQVREALTGLSTSLPKEVGTQMQVMGTQVQALRSHTPPQLQDALAAARRAADSVEEVKRMLRNEFARLGEAMDRLPERLTPQAAPAGNPELAGLVQKNIEVMSGVVNALQEPFEQLEARLDEVALRLCEQLNLVSEQITARDASDAGSEETARVADALRARLDAIETSFAESVRSQKSMLQRLHEELAANWPARPDQALHQPSPTPGPSERAIPLPGDCPPPRS
jgi:DNA repair exonuclease SbcCD ATPase subunit